MDRCKQLYHFAERNRVVPESDMDQLSWKIYAGTGYSRMNRIQVFEKPDTGGTMDDGDKKSDFADAAITEIEQGFPDVF
jgi:hypothetical protein